MKWYLLWLLRCGLGTLGAACFMGVCLMPVVSSYLLTEGPRWIKQQYLDASLSLCAVFLSVAGFVACVVAYEVKPK